MLCAAARSWEHATYASTDDVGEQMKESTHDSKHVNMNKGKGPKFSTFFV